MAKNKSENYISGYVSYRKDLFKKLKKISPVLRLLTVVLVNKAKDREVFIYKDEAIKLIRLTKPNIKPYRTINKLFNELEDAKFIKIKKDDKAPNGKQYFVCDILLHTDTKNGLHNPFTRLPINLLEDTKNISSNELLVVMGYFSDIDIVKSKVSQKELEKLLQLSDTTITSITKSLNEKGIIKPSGRGRGKSIMLGKIINGEKIFFYYSYRAETEKDNTRDKTKTKLRRKAPNTQKSCKDIDNVIELPQVLQGKIEAPRVSIASYNIIKSNIGEDDENDAIDVRAFYARKLGHMSEEKNKSMHLEQSTDSKQGILKQPSNNIQLPKNGSNRALRILFG